MFYIEVDDLRQGAHLGCLEVANEFRQALFELRVYSYQQCPPHQ
jgi:hypothetical protein